MILPPGGETAFVPNTSTNTLAAIHLESGKTKLIPTDKRPQGAVRSHDGKFPYLTNSEGNSITMIDIAKQENIGRIPTGAGPNRIALTPDGKTLVYQNLFCAPIGSSAIRAHAGRQDAGLQHADRRVGRGSPASLPASKPGK